MSETLIVTFDQREPMELSPVPMPFMPSESPAKWLAFQRVHVKGTELELSEQKAIVQFMLRHKTEALTDGRRCYTLAGDMLAFCDPIKAVYGFSLGTGWFMLEGQPDCFVRGEPSNEGMWLEAQVYGDELIVSGKRSGLLGGVMYATESFFTMRVSKHDQKAIDEAATLAWIELNNLVN